MMELTIQDQVYGFNFGMGFLREINKTRKTKVDGGIDKNIGLRYQVLLLIDGSTEALVDTLDLANKGQNPRVTKALLDAYVDDPDTDIDALFEDVLGNLKTANATRKEVLQMLEAVAAEQKKESRK